MKEHYKIKYRRLDKNGDYINKYMDWNTYEEVEKRLETFNNNPKIDKIVVLKRTVDDVTDDFIFCGEAL